MQPTSAEDGQSWGCAACGGRAMTVGMLRRRLARPLVNELWQAARAARGRTDRRCPFCAYPMAALSRSIGGEDRELDVCGRCDLFWFDGGEFEAAEGEGAPEPLDPPQERAARDRRELGKAMAAMEAERRSGSGEISLDSWEALPAVFGLPIEEGDALRGRPWTTWILAAVIAAVGIATIPSGLAGTVRTWGLVPAEAFRHGGLDWITSFFLHGGWFHLLANLYFLVVFGDNVEDVLRPARYLGLLLGATLAADLAWVLLAHGGRIPTVGASGGVSGVLAFYALAFPHARVKLTWFFYFRVYGFAVSARSAFALWVLLQFAGAWLQIMGASHVNAVAHLGGAAAGVVAWLAWRGSIPGAQPVAGGMRDGPS